MIADAYALLEQEQKESEKRYAEPAVKLDKGIFQDRHPIKEQPSMIDLTNEDIANILFEEITLRSGDCEIRNHILGKLKNNIELNEQIREIYQEIAGIYFTNNVVSLTSCAIKTNASKKIIEELDQDRST